MSTKGRMPLISFSQTEFVYDGEEIFCKCKKLAPRETTWMDENPGRRFYGCANYKGGGCDFFKRYDRAMSKRANELLVAFRNSERHLARENESLAKEKERLRRQLTSLGWRADEVGSTGKSNKESGREIGSLQSNVLEQTTSTKVVEYDELLQHLIEMTYEIEKLRSKN